MKAVLVKAASPPSTIDVSDSSTARWRDWVLAFGAVLILTDALDVLLYALFDSRAKLAPGLPVSRGLLFLVFMAAGVLLAGHLRAAADRIRAAWCLWPAVALTVASAVWSDQPVTTLGWSAALVGVSAFGIALVASFSALDQAIVTAGVVFIIALGSALTVLVWPAFGLAPTGEWQGLYLHKNLLGKVMALGVASSFVVALSGEGRAASTPQSWSRRLRAWLASIVVFVCAAVLLATDSRASALAALAAVAAATLLRAARVWRRHATAILVSGTAVTIVLVAFLVLTNPGLSLMARSPNLSDRTTIWRAVIDCAMEAPWIGHGYGAFWPGPAGQQALALTRLPYPIGQAHNGALDLFAELGMSGLVLVLVPLGMFTAAAFRHALEPGGHACIWPATYLVFFLASNAAESALLRHKVYWALYLAVACHLARRRNGRLHHGLCAAADPPPGVREASVLSRRLERLVGASYEA